MSARDGSSPLVHRPYPKIDNRARGTSGGGDWVATEKVHGAQLVVATDGATVRVGKRKAWLSEGDVFFGWQLLRAELERAARRAHESVGGRGVLRVYGELYGGGYPHSDVPPVPGLSPVQTGVWYRPDLGFVAFDLLLEDGDDDGSFLSHDELQRVAASSGLSTVPVLARGSRADVERHPTRFSTQVPSALGLPEFAENSAEGYVLKPAAGAPPSSRVVFKKKIPDFDEARFAAALPFDETAHLTLSELREVASLLVNEARIASARSKVGTSSHALAEEATLDVMVDLELMFPRRMQNLAPDEERALSEHVRIRVDDAPSRG